MNRSLFQHLAALLVGAGCVALGGCYGKNTQREFVQNPPKPPPGPGLGALPPLPFVPAPVGLRVLLTWQYKNAVTDLLGTAAGRAVTPPPDTQVSGYSAVGAAQLSLTDTAISLYEQSAQAAAQAALADPAQRAALVTCTPASFSDAACLTQVVTTFGRRAFRRSLTSDEVTTWVGVGTAAATAYSDFNKGVEFAVAGLIQSPNFLYLVELGAPDPTRPGRLKLTGLEMASRLSFFLSGSTPNTQLLDAAEAGGLDGTDGLRSAAQGLLQQATARDALHRFFDELLLLNGLATLPKDPATFPMFTPQLASAMQTEAETLIDGVVWEEQGDIRQIFDAPYTYVNQDLANLYGVPPPATGFAQVTLPPASLRGGILGEAAFLSLMSHPVTTSPTRRGKFVRERLLCQPIPNPPANVVTVLPPSPPGHPQTMRDKLMVHQQNPSCSGCHVLMDDIGLGLDNFDALGRFQTTEEGLTIDAAMTVSDLGTFSGPAQLGSLLKGDPRTAHCLARSIFRHASGHVDTPGETAPLQQMDDAFEASGYNLKNLLVELVASDAFRYASASGAAP